MSVETSSGPTAARPAEALRGLCGGAVHLPGDAAYDTTRTPWNLAVHQLPAAVAVPRDADDVGDVVRAAATAGLRVAPQPTGQQAGPLARGGLEDVVVLRTSALAGVSVDPVSRTARVLGGTPWREVVDACAADGLVALHGSSPDVSVAGDCLGGGLGWYSRRFGFGCNSVVALDVVLASGRQVRADPHQNRDLFWALRGGGGSFGVVTALELRLEPVEDVCAGMLVWDRRRADEVVRAWARWAPGCADAVTTALRVMDLPSAPVLPPYLRGRQVVVVDGAVLGGDELAHLLLAPLRALGPEVDTFARVAPESLKRLHLDPEVPTPTVSDHVLLEDLPTAAVDTLLRHVGDGSTTSLLSAELRQLGGALARRPSGAGALSRTDARYAATFVGVAATPQLAALSLADARAVTAALEPWSTGRVLLGLTEARVDAASGFDPSTWDRLRSVRAKVDPAGLFAAAHDVPGSRAD